MLILHTIINIYPHISFMNRERALNCSENSCAMQLIISHLVQDQHTLMKYVSVYTVYMIENFIYYTDEEN